MPERKRRARRNRHYRIDHELKGEDHVAYCDYLREPRTTNKSAHAWLIARGYTTFSESAVARHRRHCLEQDHENRRAMDQARRWTTLAREVRRHGGDVVDGAVFLSEVMTVKALFNLNSDQGLSAEDLRFYAELISRLLETRARMGELQRAPKETGERAGGPPARDEQKEEELYRKVCEVLKQPYHPPAERAELNRQSEEAEARYAADVAAGRRKSLEEQFGGGRN